MQLLGLTLGIISTIGMFIFFIPFLGALNWLNIPLAIAGLIFSSIGVMNARRGRSAGIAGIILCSIAIAVGVIRLDLGCGIL